MIYLAVLLRPSLVVSQYIDNTMPIISRRMEADVFGMFVRWLFYASWHFLSRSSLTLGNNYATHCGI